MACLAGSQIVARINGILAEKGISKQDFYRDCSISSASYSQWNTGKTSPRTKNLEVIAQYLNTTVVYLLTGEGEKEKPPAQSEELSTAELELLNAYRDAPANIQAAIRTLLKDE